MRLNHLNLTVADVGRCENSSRPTSASGRSPRGAAAPSPSLVDESGFNPDP